jgi:hypothetical protein
MELFLQANPNDMYQEDHQHKSTGEKIDMLSEQPEILAKEEGCGCGGGCGCHSSAYEEEEQDIAGHYPLNMVADRARVLGEIYGALEHHGQFTFSDVVTRGDLPRALKLDADMYLGCISGSLTLEECLKMLGDTGFEEITVHSISKVLLPDAMLHYYLPPEEAQEFREGEPGMYSVVISVEKPCCHAGEEDHVCCGNHSH